MEMPFSETGRGQKSRFDGRNQDISVVHVEYKILLNTQMEMLRRQLNIKIYTSGEAGLEIGI